MEENRAMEPHTLTIESRGHAVVTGVSAVNSFNDEEIVLETPMGELALVGEALRIEQLDLDHGKLCVVGELVMIEYGETKPKKERKGLFGRQKNR